MLLSGYKTYAIAILFALAGLAHGLDYIDRETFLSLLALLNGGGFAALRAGVTTEVEQEKKRTRKVSAVK